MSAIAATLMCFAGVYLYVSVYSAALAVARPAQREYASFAGYCGCLALYAFASALTWEVASPSGAAGAQNLQMLAVLPSLAFFVRLALSLSDEKNQWLERASCVVAVAGMMAVASRLFYDPAIADPSWAWVTATTTRPLAQMSIIGVVVLAAMATISLLALLRLFIASRGRVELQIAAGLTSVSAILSIFDLVARTLSWPTWLHLGTSGAILSVLGFSYVLLGRFTRVDAQLESRKEEIALSYDYLRLTEAEIVKTEQLAAVGELSAVIAHEVRNPLSIIKNAVSGLRRSKLRPEDGETLLTILDEETDRLNRLVNDLLTYAKPIAPGSATDRVDLQRLVGHAIELAAGGNRDISHIEIELELDREVDQVEGDEALLRHALINIVDNALQAMPTGGTLTVSCRNTVADGRAHVAVDFHDTGEGMDTLVRSRARDPFFTTRQSGTGLGLAIVDRVARAHGGRVEFESRHGEGTTVSLIIPRERFPSEA